MLIYDFFVDYAHALFFEQCLKSMKHAYISQIMLAKHY